eukprot:3291277-Pleurochrysis_carterae.AAC.2
MDMGGAGCSVDSVGDEEVSELGREELAGIVAVEGADDLRSPPVASVAVVEGCEGGDESAHGGRSFALGT